MPIDQKGAGVVGAGHGYGGMLLQVETVWNEVKNRFPGSRFMGGFNNRNVRGGTNKSMHAYGRAFDVGHNPETMQQIAEFCRKISGVQYVIYNRKISYKGGAWTRYDGESPHTDHVHVDFLLEFKGYGGAAGGAAGGGIYTVIAGDNLTKIANKFNMKLSELVKKNPQIENINLIKPGDKIHLF